MKDEFDECNLSSFVTDKVQLIHSSESLIAQSSKRTPTILTPLWNVPCLKFPLAMSLPSWHNDFSSECLLLYVSLGKNKKKGNINYFNKYYRLTRLLCNEESVYFLTELIGFVIYSIQRRCVGSWRLFS
jgi:hypothetical protein